MSMPIVEGGQPKNLSASGAITNCACTIIGFFVATTSSGVITVQDGGSGGTTLCGSITPAAGAFYRFPANIGSATGAYMTLVSGSINVTWFTVPTGGYIA